MIRRRAGRSGRSTPSARDSQIQRALRRSRGRQAGAWLGPRWLSILCAGGIFVLALALLTSPRFKVEQVVVRRESASAQEAMTRATQLSQVVGHNIFLVNTNRVAAELAAIPSVRRARVVPRLPNTVEIEIVERVPIAIWKTPAATFLVDDQGYVLAEAGEESPEKLLGVKDTTAQEVRLGDRVDQHTLLAARELVKAFPAAGVQVKEVELSPQGLVLITDQDWRVVIGDTERLNKKLANLKAIVDLARTQSLRLGMIDLRPQDRPFYQLATG